MFVMTTGTIIPATQQHGLEPLLQIKYNLMKRIAPLLLVPALLSGCGRIDSIPYVPTQTPETWLRIQPFVELQFGSQSIILVQPSTSLIVYLLGLITMGAGAYFLQIRNGQVSRVWWGIALLLWGGGALLAGTSYEAFSYAIKCAGRETCLWTSWWEIVYLIVSVWSIDAMVLAVAHSSTSGQQRRWLSIYAILNAVIYFILVMIGTWIPVKLLISFEFLLLAAAPGIITLFFINTLRYVKQRQPIDLLYLGTWAMLGGVIAAYFLYYLSGITASLWEKGLWFSENDVLHIGLILWMLYITFLLAPRVKDLPVTA